MLSASSPPDLWLLPCEDADASTINLWASVLSEDERDRAAARAKFEDKVSYVAAHALLRVMMGKKTDAAPKDLRFTAANEGGKPALCTAHPAFFNISHTDGFAAVAIAQDEAGVDVERADAEGLTSELTAFAFHPREIEFLASCPAPDRKKTAVKIWTAKEAYAKALGAGLTLPFSDFRVRVAPPGIEAENENGISSKRASLWIGEAFKNFVVSLCVINPTRKKLTPSVHFLDSDIFSREVDLGRP